MDDPILSIPGDPVWLSSHAVQFAMPDGKS
jgi:hypothetical protein